MLALNQEHKNKSIAYAVELKLVPIYLFRFISLLCFVKLVKSVLQRVFQRFC